MTNFIFDTQRNVEAEYLSNDASIINYVNAWPGTGKTRQFDKHIAIPHIKGTHNSVLVYAAPTEALLEERYNSLLRRLRSVYEKSPKLRKLYKTFDALKNHRIYRVTSSDTTGRVANDLLYLLNGQTDSEGNVISKPVQNGVIILCTHECIASMPAFADNPKGRNRVCLVYDEARACLQDNFSVNIPDALYDYLFTPALHTDWDGKKLKKPRALIFKNKIHETVLDDTNSEGLAIWSWSNKAVPVPSYDIIESLAPNFKAKQIADVLEFLQLIYSSSVDMYVVEEKKRGKDYRRVFNVHSPNNMFQGYAKVLILSAFFQTSQMYHFLNSDYQVRSAEKPVLKDITFEYLDNDWVQGLLDRMCKAHLTYIFDLGKKELTKTAISNAIITSKMSSDDIQDINKRWHEVYGDRPESYRKVYQAMQKSENKATTIKDISFKRGTGYSILHSFQSEGLKIHGSPILFMVKQSIRLQRAFLKKHRYPVETLPITINKTYSNIVRGKKMEERTSVDVWQAEGLNQFNNHPKLKRPKDGLCIEQLPVMSHGLNKWQHLHTIAFLATMKYSKPEADLLNAVIGGPDGYKPEVDRTIDNAIQSLWRCMIRQASEDDVLLIVADKSTAVGIAERFRETAKKVYKYKKADKLLPLLDPSSLVKTEEVTILNYTFDAKASMDRRHANYKESVKGRITIELRKLYLKTRDGKQRNNLDVQLQQAKRAGDTKKVARLEKERKKYPTLGEWKKTNEGKAALASINLTNVAKKTTKEKLLKVLNDSKFWSADRAERIGYCAAAFQAGLSRDDIKAYPQNDGSLGLIPLKNWNGDLKKISDPAAFILARAKKLRIQF